MDLSNHSDDSGNTIVADFVSAPVAARAATTNTTDSQGDAGAVFSQPRLVTCLACGGSEWKEAPLSEPLPTQAETDRSYANALASDLRARGEVYSASLVERLLAQAQPEQPRAKVIDYDYAAFLLQDAKTRYDELQAKADRELMEMAHKCGRLQSELLVALTQARREWFEKGRNIADLIRWLIQEGDIGQSDFEDIMAVIENPKEWSAEYDQMRDAERELAATTGA